MNKFYQILTKQEIDGYISLLKTQRSTKHTKKLIKKLWVWLMSILTNYSMDILKSNNILKITNKLLEFSIDELMRLKKNTT